MTRLLRRLLGLPGLRHLWLQVLRARNESADRCPTEVEPGVFVGGVVTRARWAALRAAGVTHVVCLLAEAAPDRWLAEADSVLWLAVPDRDPPSPEQFRAGCAFLDAARAQGRAVSIYCGSGMGRAPTMYVAWWLRRESRDVTTAIRVVQNARPVAKPTLRQREALERWARSER